MRLNDQLRDRQAETHAGLLGRKEAVEHMRQVLRINTRAAVFDDTAHGLRIDLLCSNGNTPVHHFQLGHGLYRIDYKVHDNLPQLSVVDHHPRQVGRQVERIRDVPGLEFVMQQSRAFGDDFGERSLRLPLRRIAIAAL